MLEIIHASRFRNLIKKLAQGVRLRYLTHQDIRRFERNASLSVYDRNVNRLATRILYNVHALEKGLARNLDERPAFGARALMDLNDAMFLYKARGYDTASFAYREGLGGVKKYIDHHTEIGHETEFLTNILSGDVFDSVHDSDCAGTKVVHKSEKLANSSKTFADLALGRTSVREFSGESIDTRRVSRAISLARKSPSVCNRQGWHVYWIEDKDLMSDVLRNQRGFGYRVMPEVLLVVGVSNATFVSPVERNQGYVDGGLFCMSLLYGLEAEGLAAVPLNACLYSRAERNIRRLVGIDDGDSIIMFIAVGDFLPSSKAPVADRLPTANVIVRR